MLLQRTLTALIGIPVVLGAVYLGAASFFALIAAVALIAMREWLLLNDKISSSYPLLGYLVLAGMLLAAYFVNVALFLTAIILSILILFLFITYYYPRVDLPGILLSYVGALYIGIAITSVYFLRQQWGIWPVVTLLLLNWGTDSGAYFVGKSLGKRKFAPSISPKKTWEGFFGGLAVSVLVGLFISYFWDIGIIHIISLSLLISFAGQMGDLTESVFKRSAGVKDSGNIIPGHGGMLDRMDSLLMAAPVAYIFLYWLIID